MRITREIDSDLRGLARNGLIANRPVLAGDEGIA